MPLDDVIEQLVLDLPFDLRQVQYIYLIDPKYRIGALIIKVPEPIEPNSKSVVSAMARYGLTELAIGLVYEDYRNKLALVDIYTCKVPKGCEHVMSIPINAEQPIDLYKLYKRGRTR